MYTQHNRTNVVAIWENFSPMLIASLLDVILERKVHATQGWVQTGASLQEFGIQGLDGGLILDIRNSLEGTPSDSEFSGREVKIYSTLPTDFYTESALYK